MYLATWAYDNYALHLVTQPPKGQHYQTPSTFFCNEVYELLCYIGLSRTNKIALWLLAINVPWAPISIYVLLQRHWPLTWSLAVGATVMELVGLYCIVRLISLAIEKHKGPPKFIRP